MRRSLIVGELSNETRAEIASAQMANAALKMWDGEALVPLHPKLPTVTDAFLAWAKPRCRGRGLDDQARIKGRPFPYDGTMWWYVEYLTPGDERWEWAARFQSDDGRVEQAGFH
jgi:hypothetical protein